ncbi:MAG: hypothetical protein HY736_02815 [Verrucomicrobia bacterium]|nr:hypothetical protein [Verrucomicrobiota bacterium]
MNPRNSDIALTWVQCLHAQRFFARAERAAEQALALLDQAMSGPILISANQILHAEPWWKPLHAEPRFKAALAKAAPRD